MGDYTMTIATLDDDRNIYADEESSQNDKPSEHTIDQIQEDIRGHGQMLPFGREAVDA